MMNIPWGVNCDVFMKIDWRIGVDKYEVLSYNSFFYMMHKS